MDLEIEHRADAPSVVHLTVADSDSATVLDDALALAENTGDDAPVWVHGARPDTDAAMHARGYSSSRTLLQMRVPLPVDSPALPTESFTEADMDELIAVNNRAFHWHPEQSGRDRSWVQADMGQPWFDADGIRLHRIDGRLAGFCWTKIHREPEALGEIYVIAVDPDFHGRGLGKPMTMAGLDWLHGAGLDTGMLYVESDNDAAVATYRGLGFEIHRHDRLWRRT